MTFPKTRPPHNIRVLHGWLREYAGERRQAEGRLKRTVDYTLVLTALDRVRDSTGNRMFAVKGGVAMELRLRLSARATRDLDAVFLGTFEEWLEAFDEAVDQPVADFELSRGEPTTIRTTRTMRVDVYLDYRGRRWGTVTPRWLQPRSATCSTLTRSSPLTSLSSVFRRQSAFSSWACPT